MDSDYPRGTCENVVYHFHGTIQTIITSYLRPVNNSLIHLQEKNCFFADLGVLLSCTCIHRHRHRVVVMPTVWMVLKIQIVNEVDIIHHE